MFISKISFNFKSFFSSAAKPIFASKKLQLIKKQRQIESPSLRNQVIFAGQEQQRLTESSIDMVSFKQAQSTIFHQNRSQLGDYLYNISQLVNPQQYEKHKLFLEQTYYKTRKTGSQLTLTTQQLLKILIFTQTMQKYDKKQTKMGGFQVRMSTLAAQIILSKDLTISEAVTLYCLLDSLGYKTLQVVQNLAAFLKIQLQKNKKLSIQSFLVILGIHSDKSIKTVIENILADQVLNNMKLECIQDCQSITLHIQNIRLLSELQVWRFYKTNQKKLLLLLQGSLKRVKKFLESKSIEKTNLINHKQLSILLECIQRINKSYKCDQSILLYCQDIGRCCEILKKNDQKIINLRIKIEAVDQKLIESHLSAPYKIIEILLQTYKQSTNFQALINFIQTNSQVWKSIQNVQIKQCCNKKQQQQLMQFLFLTSCSQVQCISKGSQKLLNSLAFSQISVYQFLNSIAYSKFSETRSHLFKNAFSSRFQKLSFILVSFPTNGKFHYHKWQIFISYYLKKDRQTKFKLFQIMKICFLEALQSENARKVVLLTYFSNIMANGQIEATKQQLQGFVDQIVKLTLDDSKTFHYHCYLRIVTNLLVSEYLSLKIFQSIIILGKKASLKQLYDNCLLMLLFGMYLRANDSKTQLFDNGFVNYQLKYLSKGLKSISFNEAALKNQEKITNATTTYLSTVFMSGLTDFIQRSEQISSFIKNCRSYTDFQLMLNTYLMKGYKCRNQQQQIKLILLNNSFINKLDTFCRQEEYKKYLSVAKNKLIKIDSYYKHL